ncbi:damage-control phosphatase ARMT1 family protein [Streptomyces sp. VRA16 Mangrove soil]|uniref:damage-control phosphatase ARMT1 family protein n=1 Tax=Streptomyces sp. VRA16 Mangrove soil TaxID=2817434 RepID=UPI001A9DA547|nr:damage-control phosphatase ARMT1 family protein [Streptomyces sp. VRA16 Mangrove soil]MBO1330947.1 protein-glutamate O-methyltransferase family protein [Streptomyces sp. VRA16 Mangrove soil]
MLSDPAPVIVSAEPGSFPRSVFLDRHPALIRRVRDAFPYEPEQHRALDALLEESTRGVVQPLADGLPGAEHWDAWGLRAYVGQSWLDVPFLWAESFFYRKLLDAVGYFAPGPWQGVDPFRPFKQAELRTAEAAEERAAAERVAALPADEQSAALLHGSLWGNRADLGFRMGATGGADADGGSPVIVDDSDALWRLLPAGAAGTVYLVADNAGRELVPDLLLVDHLLRHGRAARVALHVKPYPYYVSDATTSDVVDALRHLRGGAGGAGERLWAAMGDGRLTVRAHPFSCAPLPYADMPDDLRKDFAAATVTLFKGDLNYRRLVGDRLWPATTSFAAATAYFPGPVAALRTLKSQVIVGLDAATEESLDAALPGEAWRTGGTHAVVQVRP